MFSSFRNTWFDAAIILTINPETIMDRVCRDAATDGYEYIEAYPHRGETDIYVNHHGPYTLYEKFGFALHKDMERDSVLRKYLQEEP